MPLRRACLAAAAAVLLAACGPAVKGGPSTAARLVPPPTVPPAHRKSPARHVAVPVVKVAMTDRFRFRPDAIMVAAGQTVTFAVTNTGQIDHEFVLGDRADQAAHEREMREMAGMAMGDEPEAVTVPPGATKRLTWTFDRPGTVIYGCHVVGHYPMGMRGTITVLPRPLAVPQS
jgi:uncharacterized cupredoxin-like copper-binding protein